MRCRYNYGRQQRVSPLPLALTHSGHAELTGTGSDGLTRAKEHGANSEL